MAIFNVEILRRTCKPSFIQLVYFPFLIVFCTMLSGCFTPATIKTTPVIKVTDNKNREKAIVPTKESIHDLMPTTAVDGIIFGKADFRGILKVEYVKLAIVDENDPQQQYELLFGERDEHNAPRWDARPIEPHYFFLELPAGRYRITTISIPVGTTLATENADISFTVGKGTVIYLGTLRVIGTDQKIRFGGVPLLRPGFEYRVEIVNEKDEALVKFKNKYPDLKREIQVNLMKAMRFQSF